MSKRDLLARRARRLASLVSMSAPEPLIEKEFRLVVEAGNGCLYRRRNENQKAIGQGQPCNK